MIRLLVVHLLFFSFHVWAEPETILVVDTADNRARSALLIKKAQERGANIIFYPGVGVNPGEKNFLAGAKKAIETVKYDTLILAGHSQASGYHGLKGDLKAADIIESAKKNPYAQKNCKSFLGLGCNTVCEAYARKLKGGFPALELAYGYCGSADLSYRDEALKYVNSYFDKRDGIFLQKSAEDIKNYLDTFEGIKDSNAAVWMSCNAGNFMYTNNEDTQVSEIENDDPILCEKKIQEFIHGQKIKEQYDSYNLLLKNPPHDTDKGELRVLYNIVNKNRFCFEKKGHNFNNLFKLLFFHSYKENFLKFYQGYTNKLKNDLEKTPESEVLKVLNEKKQGIIEAKARCEKDLKVCLAEIKNFDKTHPYCKASPPADKALLEKFALTCMKKTSDEGPQDETNLQIAYLNTLNKSIMKIGALEAGVKEGKYANLAASALERISKLTDSKNPDEITAEDMDRVQRTLYEVEDYLPGNALIRRYGLLIDELRQEQEYSAFPFKWHEKPKDGAVKVPDFYSARKEYIDALVKQTPKNKPWFAPILEN